MNNKQDELLLTEEEEAISFKEIRYRDNLEFITMLQAAHCSAQVQLAKARPIIEKQRDVAWIKALMRGGIMVSEPKQLEGIGNRLRQEGAKEEGERIMRIIQRYSLDVCSARDDVIEKQAKGWQILKGD